MTRTPGTRLRTLAMLPLVVVLLCALCLGGPGAGERAALAASPSGIVDIWVGSWWDSQVPLITKAWAHDYPTVTLKFEPLPINGYLDKFIAAALGGTPPDIIDLDATWVSTVAAKNLLQPLDQDAKGLDVKDYVPSVWAASHYNGTLYTMPNRASSVVFFYNKTVFDKAGVPYPTDRWTYDTMLSIARKLTIPGQQSGVGIAADLSDPSNAMDLLSSMIWAYGGDFLNTDHTQAVINQPRAVAGLTYWSELYTRYHVAPQGTPNFTTTRDLLPLFEANKVGLIAGSSNITDELLKHPDVKWGAVLAPQKVNRSGGWTMGVPVGAKNSAGARAFLVWFSDADRMGHLMNRTPARFSAYKIAPWNDPKYTVFIQALKDARAVPSVANWFGIQTVVITEAQKMLVGQETPQQAADAMAKQIDAILAEK